MGWWDCNQHTQSARSGVKKGERPELRYTQGGKAVCTIPSAIKQWNAQLGEDQTGWIDIVFWEKVAEEAAQKLGPGVRYTFWGELRFSFWKDKNTGADRQKPCFWARGFQVAQDDRKDGGGGNYDYGGGEPGASYGGGSSGGYSGQQSTSQPASPAYYDFDVGDLGPPLDMDDNPLSE